MLKRLAYGTVAIALLCLCVFFAVTVLYLAWSEVLPATRQGTLSVETNSMILNVLWEGNEIYILLVAYLLMAVGSGYGAVRIFGAAIASK